MARLRAWLAAGFVAALTVGAPAWADPPPDRAAAQERFDAAEQASRDRRFGAALAAYREALALDPSAPFAAAARARSADLAAHAEGGFEPLARLEALRREPRGAGRPAIEALDRDLSGFPEGRVRAEARLLVAEAWWHRFGEPLRAIPQLEAAIADPAADRLTRALALSELVAIRRERGELGAALAAVEREPELLPALHREVGRLVRRGRLSNLAVGVLAFLALAGAISLLRLAIRSRDVRDLPARVVRPLAVAASLYLGGAAAVVARLHGGADARPFVWLGLGVLAVDVIARAWRLASVPEGLAPRIGRALVCVAGVAAVAFLAMERTSVSYLESFGL